MGGALVAAGGVLILAGLMGLRFLLGTPADGQSAHLPRTLFPLVGGLWLAVGGAYALLHGGGREDRVPVRTSPPAPAEGRLEHRDSGRGVDARRRAI
jgi:hypothetical protein